MNDLEQKKIFSANLKKYMDLKKASINDISNCLKIPYTTLWDWLNAKKYPRSDNSIKLLANFLGIEESDLTGNKNFAKNDEKYSSIFQDLEILLSKNKEILTKSDEQHIRFIVESRIKEIDENKFFNNQ